VVWATVVVSSSLQLARPTTTAAAIHAQRFIRLGCARGATAVNARRAELCSNPAP
jgi:hypothetical protein